MNIFQLSLLVRDYDEAIEFYCNKMEFNLIEDTDLGENKRWVVISPKNSEGCSLLLARAAKPEQESAIGNQSGGRVFLFLHTDDFWSYYKKLLANGIEFTEEPRKEEYGTVVVFKDLYGNKWDLIEKHQTL